MFHILDHFPCTWKTFGCGCAAMSQSSSHLIPITAFSSSSAELYAFWVEIFYHRNLKLNSWLARESFQQNLVIFKNSPSEHSDGVGGGEGEFDVISGVKPAAFQVCLHQCLKSPYRAGPRTPNFRLKSARPGPREFEMALENFAQILFHCIFSQVV